MYSYNSIVFIVQSLEEHVEKRRIQQEQLEKWWNVNWRGGGTERLR